MAATTANVDYQVSNDGTAIWLGYNPCGFYRANGSDCYWGDPFQQPEGGSIKVVVDDYYYGDGIENVEIMLVNEDEPGPGLNNHVSEHPIGPNYIYLTTDPNGAALATIVREGKWKIYIIGVPLNSHGEPMYEFDPDEVIAEITLNTGEDIEVSWTLMQIYATKTVYVGIENIQVCRYRTVG